MSCRRRPHRLEPFLMLLHTTRRSKITSSVILVPFAHFDFKATSTNGRQAAAITNKGDMPMLECTDQRRRTNQLEKTAIHEISIHLAPPCSTESTSPTHRPSPTATECKFQPHCHNYYIVSMLAYVRITHVLGSINIPTTYNS